MNNICGLPYSEIELDQFGNLVDPLSLDNIAPADNLFVMVHGWNSSIDDARCLYQNLFAQVSRILETRAIPQSCAVLGIVWPSEEYVPAHDIDRLMNLATYHMMKERAGLVGRTGLARSLDQIQTDFPGIRIHLAGHSFGCRVIASAAAAAEVPVASMTLFQAAFSHNSFSPDYDSTHRPGGFRSVILDHKCIGPMLITHSVNDEAVGLCYPLASRILRQHASSFGAENDLYGALGRNGALHTPEAIDFELLAEGEHYRFAPARIYNLRADNIIQSHGDIARPETAWALISAAGLDGNT